MFSLVFVFLSGHHKSVGWEGGRKVSGGSSGGVGGHRSLVPLSLYCQWRWGRAQSGRHSPIRDSVSEGSHGSEFSLVLVTVRSAREVTRGQRSAPIVLQQRLCICGLRGREGRTADKPDQLWDLVIVHSRKRRGDVV